MKKFIITTAVWCMLQGLCAFSSTTSLNIIPIADVIDPGTVRLGYENDGYSRLLDSESENYWFFEIGAAPKLEIGADFYRAGEDSVTYLNAKYSIAPETDDFPALAVGAQDIGEGSSPTYFLTAAKTFGRQRFHAGAIGDRHYTEPMLGYEYTVNDNTWLLLDWINGDDNYLAAGVSYQVESGPAVTLSHGWSNTSDGDDLTYVNLAWEWSATPEAE